MSLASRLFKIWRVATRHRLDTFFAEAHLPPSGRLFTLPARVLPRPKRSRGARLRQALEDLGPVFVKFGQLLSTRPDLIPPDICAELDNLQDNVAPFDSDTFIGIVEKALGDRVENLFGEFHREPLASASVAQVHAARLKDGREVVVKAIRPGIEKVIHQDIELLFTLARWIERSSAEGRRLRPVEVVQDYQYTIFDELNLQREAANTATLRRNFDHSPLLYVPEVHWPLTNEKVMVTERIYATPVTDVETLAEKGTDFRELAERGVQIFFTQVFEHNFFHADMHPGNIFVDAANPARPRYLAVDCAIIGTLSQRDRHYLARNLLAIFRRDYRQVAELHVLSGWVPEDTPIGQFEAAIRTVCEPIFERPLREISFGQLLVSLFRTAQRFDMEVQPSLVLLQKTLLNIEGLGRQLYPDLDLWATAHPYMEQWLRDQFRPDTLLAQLKRHGPEWLEQFPQVPQMLYQSLEQLQRLDRTVSERNQPKSRRSSLPTAVGAALTGVGLGLALPHWQATVETIPAASLVLVGAGLLFLLVRR